MTNNFRAVLTLLSLAALHLTSSVCTAQVITSSSNEVLQSLRIRTSGHIDPSFIGVRDLDTTRVESVSFTHGQPDPRTTYMPVEPYCAVTQIMTRPISENHSIFTSNFSPVVRRVSREEAPYISPNGLAAGRLRILFSLDNHETIEVICFRVHTGDPETDAQPFTDDELVEIMSPDVVELFSNSVSSQPSSATPAPAPSSASAN